MKKKLFVVIYSIFFFFIYNSCKNYNEKELIGTYVNNYNEDINPMSIPPEAPAKTDTLVLMENNIFISQYFGKGEYVISERNGFHSISLTYKEGNMLAGYELGLKQRGLFNSTVTLLINIDGDYHYKKIK